MRDSTEHKAPGSIAHTVGSRHWVLIDPVANPKVVSAMRRSVARTTIPRIGFFENHKANAAQLQNEISKRLTVAKEHRFYGKSSAAQPAPQELISKIATECDVVLLGSAD